jgi:hypothetical protein
MILRAYVTRFNASKSSVRAADAFPRAAFIGTLATNASARPSSIFARKLLRESE